MQRVVVEDLTTFPNNQKIITHTDHAEHVAVLQNSLGFTGELIRRELAAAGAIASNLLGRGQKGLAQSARFFWIF